MAKYRKISTRIWNDDKFSLLSCDAKLLFFFLLSHPHMTPLGAMRANSPGIAHELSWPLERLSEALREVSTKGMVRVDERVSCVFLPNFVKHNLPESPNVILAWEKCLDDIPDCSLKNKAIHTAREVSSTMSEAFQKAYGRLSEVFHKGMPNQEQEPEPEPEPENLSLPASSPADNCPQKEIIELYHHLLPVCPRVNAWGKNLQANLRTRWKESSDRQSLDWWKATFKEIAKSDFLMGRIQTQTGPFLFSLGWFVGPKNFEKVLNGQYANRSNGQLSEKSCNTCDYANRPGYCDHKTPEQRKNCQSWTVVKA